MELSVVNHEDYFAKIGMIIINNKFGELELFVTKDC